MSKYLDVEFGDNDFGLAITAALKRLWEWVRENNLHLIDPDRLPDMFLKLHEARKLEPMVKRLFVLEQMCFEVECHTRGLYMEEHTGAKEFRALADGCRQYDNCLSCKLTFHENKGFATEWKNGEHAYLDLKTGECSTY